MTVTFVRGPAAGALSMRPAVGILREMQFWGWIAAATLLVACSGGNDQGAGTTGGVCMPAPLGNACIDGCNPCTRLADQQVAAVIGQSATGQANDGACKWDYDDAQGNLSFEVSFWVGYDDEMFQNFCHLPPAENIFAVTPVSGVGDDACYLSTPAVGSGLNFLKGCWAYQINIEGPTGQAAPFPDAMVQADEKALALDALPNL
jgi:hypothetical protein